MDDKTFNELIKKGELSLILMDGGADLTPQQMAKVKKTAADLSDARLEEMAVELAGTPGYMEFMMLPLMSKIVGNTFKKTSKEKPNQTKEQSSNTSVKEESKEKPVGKKDPQLNTIAPTAETPLKPGDSEGDILGKIFNLMVKSYHERDAEFKEETEYKQKLAEKKEERSKELIGLFTAKQKKKPKKEPEKKKEKPKKKEEEKKKAGKTAEPAPKETPNATPKVEKVTKPPTGSVSTGIAAIAGGAGLAAVASTVIAKEEGVATKAYWDPPGQNTLVSVGYGHQIQPEEYNQGFIQAGDERIPIKGNRGIDTTITKDQAQKLLKVDTPKYEKRASDPLGSSWNKLNEQQKSALISYAYNTGSTASLVKQGLKDAIDNGDMKLAASIIRDKGIKTAKGKYLKQLDERRHREADLFLSGPIKSNQESSSLQVVPSTDVQQIPEKMKSDNQSATPSVSVLNNNTNIIKGGTTYSIIEEIVSDYPAFLQKQFNLA